MSRASRLRRWSIAIAMATALTACQAPAPVTPEPASVQGSATLKGRMPAQPQAYRTKGMSSESMLIGGLWVVPGVPQVITLVDGKIVPIGPIGYIPKASKKRGYEHLSTGAKAEIRELVVGPDGSWEIEVPAGAVTIKLLLEDGTMVPMTFPSGQDASHWLRTEAGSAHDLGLLSASKEKGGQAERNPLGLLDTDGDAVPDALDDDDDGDGTPDAEETGAMRYHSTETQDTDRDGLGDNSDPSPTDSGHRGPETPGDQDGDGLLDLFDLDGDGKLDQTVLDYVFV